MLHAFLPYVRGVGVDTRWVVLRERPEFFELTKRLHNNLHGADGDGGALGDEQRELVRADTGGSAHHLSAAAAGTATSSSSTTPRPPASRRR